MSAVIMNITNNAVYINVIIMFYSHYRLPQSTIENPDNIFATGIVRNATEGVNAAV